MSRSHSRALEFLMNVISFVITLHWCCCSLCSVNIYDINYAMEQHTIDAFKAMPDLSVLFHGWRESEVRETCKLSVNEDSSKFRRQQNIMRNFNPFPIQICSNALIFLCPLLEALLKAKASRITIDESGVHAVLHSLFVFTRNLSTELIYGSMMFSVENWECAKCITHIYQHTIKFYGIKTCSVNFRSELGKYLHHHDTTSKSVRNGSKSEGIHTHSIWMLIIIIIQRLQFYRKFMY